MGDARDRTLQRRAWQTGAPEDQARWLAAQVRARRIPLRHVVLAACCEHPAASRAARALGCEVSPALWITDLNAWGPAPCVRAAWLSARRALPTWESAYPRDPRPNQCLTLIEAWLDPDQAAALPEPLREVELERAAELAAAEAEDAADYAASFSARPAEDAAVAAYYAARALVAAVRGTAGRQRVPEAWLRTRLARRTRAAHPPSPVDDLLAALGRAARACREAEPVTRRAVERALATLALERPSAVRLTDPPPTLH